MLGSTVLTLIVKKMKMIVTTFKNIILSCSRQWYSLNKCYALLILRTKSVFTFWFFRLGKLSKFSVKNGHQAKYNLAIRDVGKCPYWRQLPAPGCWISYIQFQLRQLPKILGLDISMSYMLSIAGNEGTSNQRHIFGVFNRALNEVTEDVSIP